MTQKNISYSKADATVDIKYPELMISGVPAAAVAKINSSIAADALAYENDFLKQVVESKGQLSGLPPEIANAPSEAFRRYQIFASADFGTISILYSDEQGFPGNAHPTRFFSAAIYDISTGDSISEQGIAAPGKLDSLYQLLAVALKNKYSLADDTYGLDPKIFPQFSKLIPEDSGVHAYVNQDTILSNAEGPADVLVPWTQLQGIVSARFTK